MTIDDLTSRRRQILDLAQQHGANNLRVFGSVARGQSTVESDLDLLVSLEPGRSLLDQIALQQDLEELLSCPVDVLVDGGISPYLRDRILTEAVPL